MLTNKKEIAFEKITTEFEKLSNLILKQLNLLDQIFTNAVAKNVKDIISQITENEIEIDQFDNRLDSYITNAVVLYQPVATDLRKLFAIYRMVNNLERISDLVVKISNYVISIKNMELFKESSIVLHQMLQLTTKMVNRALLSFFNNNKENAIWTIKKDNSIYDIHHKFLKKSLKKIKPTILTETLLLDLVDLKSIISSIERIGDHATNIAEASIYGIFGENLRHKELEK